jgi:hypothetical protein
LVEKEHNGNVAMFRHDSSSPARKAKQKKKEKKEKAKHLSLRLQ